LPARSSRKLMTSPLRATILANADGEGGAGPAGFFARSAMSAAVSGGASTVQLSTGPYTICVPFVGGAGDAADAGDATHVISQRSPKKQERISKG
jgi:hypothetical protein